MGGTLMPTVTVVLNDGKTLTYRNGQLEVNKYGDVKVISREAGRVVASIKSNDCRTSYE